MKYLNKYNIESFRKYMFLDENISRILHNNIFNNNINKKEKIIININKYNKIKIENSIFYPFQKDKLFWCFYILDEGMNKYNIARQHHYQIERDYKIKLISLLRNKKAEIKKFKLKLNELENELVNEEKITLKTFLLLCNIKYIPFICTKGSIYYEGIHQENTSFKSISGEVYCPIIEYNDINGYGIYISNTKEKIKEIKEKKMYIENINKPLLSISLYKLETLQHIANKIDINILQINGKKKQKKVLYDEILQKLI